MADSSKQQWGYELMKSSGVRSGVLYPILQRMLDAGWLVDGWEDSAESHKRPRRRYYEVTELGKRQLGCAVKEAEHEQRFSPSFASILATAK